MASPEEFGVQVMKLMMRADMTRPEAGEWYRQILLDEVGEIQQGAFMACHWAKPPRYEEVAGLWDAMMNHVVVPLEPAVTAPICDICGSGADRLKTVNASTGAAIIAAGAGVVMGKTGAQRITGKAGTADCFAAMGVELTAPDRAVAALEQCGFCFLFAPMYFKPGIGRILRQIRFASCLNVAGPLTTPWNGWWQVAGGFSPDVCDLIVGLMKEVGYKAGASPYGMVDGMPPELGMDEVSVCGPTRIVLLRGGEVSTFAVTPEEIGLALHPFEAIATSDTPEENATRIVRVVAGRDRGALHDFLCANAGLAIFMMGQAPSLAAGVDEARRAVSAGAAWDKLRAMLAVQAADREHPTARIEEMARS